MSQTRVFAYPLSRCGEHYYHDVSPHWACAYASIEEYLADQRELSRVDELFDVGVQYGIILRPGWHLYRLRDATWDIEGAEHWERYIVLYEDDNEGRCWTCDGDKSVLCQACDGSGEGLRDGSRCMTCRGRGCQPCPDCTDGPDEYDYDEE